MKLSNLQERILKINGFIERGQGDGNAMAIMLHAEVMNDLTLVLEALLQETAPERLLEIRRGAGDSDVDPISDNDLAEKNLQLEAYGAAAFDPSAPVEDLNATLDERHPINQRPLNSRGEIT